MSLMAMSGLELAGVIAGFGFTLMVFSYLLGDNPFFRLSIHIFIGVAAAFASAVAWNSVIWPQLILPLWQGSQTERLMLIAPLVLSGLVLLKASPRLSVWGTPAIAFLVGAGAATAIGGAVLGTLFPQAQATVNLFDRAVWPTGSSQLILRLFEAGLVLLGVVSTLVYFQFRARPQASTPSQRAPLVELLSWAGQVFIALALGALFAGVYAAAITALIERLRFVVSFVLALVYPQ